VKVAIYTQIRKNCGSIDEPYWKFNGGHTFVLSNITPAQAAEIQEDGIPTLVGLINCCSDFVEEYVSDWAILEDDDKVAEEWESVNDIFWSNNEWVCVQTTFNDDNLYQDLVSKTFSYKMGFHGQRENCTMSYTMNDGTILSEEEFTKKYQ
jgi:hypothetical protein